MPIRKSQRRRYPPNWKAISHRIRFERAGGRCECRGECGEQHGVRCLALHGTPIEGNANGSLVVLTTAHLDHTPENCADGNLRAMCQRCHLAYDRAEHASTRARRGSKVALPKYRIIGGLHDGEMAAQGKPHQRGLVLIERRRSAPEVDERGNGTMRRIESVYHLSSFGGLYEQEPNRVRTFWMHSRIRLTERRDRAQQMVHLERALRATEYDTL